MVAEFEEVGHILRCAIGVAGVRQLEVRISELIEEWVNHGLNCGKTLSRRVLEQFGDQINRIGIGLSEHLVHVSKKHAATSDRLLNIPY